jgi:long-subunit fatty acid transport protein
MLLRKIFSSILLLVVISGLAAINADAGTTGFTSLKIPYSARALGMGQAMTGVTASIDGLQFNPAAIMQIQDKVVSSTFNSWLVDTHAGGIHMLLPRNEYVTLGLLAHYLNYGEIERTEIGPNNEYIGTDDKFAPSNLIVGLTAARYINASIDLGASLKFVYDNIYESSATAVMIDAGLVHHPFNEKIKVGVSIRNLGKQLSYYTGEKYVEKLPFTFASGISYKLSPAFLAAVDISKPAGQDVLIKVGAEYQVHPMLALRTGYRSNAADWKTGGTWDWASGLSLGSGFSWKSYQLDYAIASYGDLGFNNQVTLGYKF